MSIMISIARKNLLKDKTKFIITVSGIALATLMVLALIGVFFGVTEATRNVPLTAGGDYWVVQKGAQSQVNSTSVLESNKEAELRSLPGMRSATPIFSNATGVEANGKRFTALVVGFDTTTGIGLSGTMYSGTKDIKSGETLVDRALAAKYHLHEGSKITVGGHEFTVAGITQGTNIIQAQYVFISFSDAKAAFDQAHIVSYYLLNSSQPLETLQKQVADILPGGQVDTKYGIADSNSEVMHSSFGPIVNLLVVVGLIVSTAITGLTIYAATMEHSKEYGILKALGVSNRRLYGIVFEQSLLASTAGFAAGLILYLIVQRMAFFILPGVVLAVPLFYYFLTFLVACTAGIISLILPIRKINAIDPAEVFNR